ncbi:MAG: putative toxin-antitoxin system toxin component, PIN family [Candidatus Nanohaloarchaea archaeon]|nr:putative toxin-antitoxin system toxin component, PIN family [Candidatus Nanohaloarchaea archaeon]
MPLQLVLDTNVIVSGNISSGSPPHTIMEACFSGGGPVVVVSRDIIKEYERKLRGVAPVAASDRDYTMCMISRYAKHVEPTISFQVGTADPDDDKLFEAAVAAGADCIVSGDSHVLEIGEFRGVEVLKPNDAVERIGPL